MSPLGVIVSIIVSAFFAGLLTLAAWRTIGYIMMLKAKRLQAAAPYAVLHEQDDVIYDMIAETEGGLVSTELRDRMLACHQAYLEIGRGNR